MIYLIKPRLPPPPKGTLRPLNLRFFRKGIFWILQVGNIIEGLGYFMPSIYLPSEPHPSPSYHTSSSFIPHLHLYLTFIHTPSSFIPHLHSYPIFIHTPSSFIPHLHSYPIFIYTSPSFIPYLHSYPIFIHSPPPHTVLLMEITN